jgi:flagella basal body P-ring formation protein FlgA
MTALIATFALAGCLAVEGPKITAGDLARADSAYGALAPEASFGYAPAPGSRRVLRRVDLQRLAAGYGHALPAAADICVERPLEAVVPERFLEAMRAALEPRKARIDLIETSQFKAPKGTLEFTLAGLARPPASNPNAAVLWRGYVRYGTGSRYPVWAKVRVVVEEARVVAVEALRPGRTIQTGKVRIECAEGFPLLEPAASSAEEVSGRVVRRLVPAGAPVLISSLADAREVERGDEVRVGAVSGNATIQITGFAETGGSIGDTVEVRNPGTGRSFRGTVNGKGSVVVEASAGEGIK